jgi:hypothetical protein
VSNQKEKVMLLENKNVVVYGAGGAVVVRWPAVSLAKVPGCS